MYLFIQTQSYQFTSFLKLHLRDRWAGLKTFFSLTSWEQSKKIFRRPSREWNSLRHWLLGRMVDGLGWSCQNLSCLLFVSLLVFLLSLKMEQSKWIALHQDGQLAASVSQMLGLISVWRWEDFYCLWIWVLGLCNEKKK